MAPAPPMQRVIFIRHAESEANTLEPKFIAGRSVSSPLTGVGIEQSLLLGDELRKRYGSKLEDIDPVVYVSPAIRTLDTAKYAIFGSTKQGGIPIQFVTDDRLLEISQGEWEEQERALCYTPEMEIIAAANPYDFKAPGGESQRDVEQRVASFIYEKLGILHSANGPTTAMANTSNKRILIFTHGFVIKSFIRHVYNSDPAMTVKTNISNTALVEFGYSAKDGWYVLRINDSGHIIEHSKVSKT